MRRASDTLDPWASDTSESNGRASDSRGRRDGNQIRMAVRGPAAAAGPLEIGHAVKLFCDAKEAEGLSPRTVRWYSDILRRAVARLGANAVLDEIEAPTWRTWLVELRATLAPVSVAGYVRCLHVFGNWLAAEELTEAAAIRRLVKPRVPRKLIEPLNDDELRELLARAGTRDQAILLLLLDTGLRVSEAAGIRFRDLRPDGAIKVCPRTVRAQYRRAIHGAKERGLVPEGLQLWHTGRDRGDMVIRLLKRHTTPPRIVPPMQAPETARVPVMEKRVRRPTIDLKPALASTPWCPACGRRPGVGVRSDCRTSLSA